MMKKFKFILTLPDGMEVDRAEEIEGHVSWPNYSQAEPVRYRGVFNTYEEAREYAADFNLYKYVTNDGYDSFEHGDDEYPYFISIYDAEDAVCAFMDVEPGCPFCVHPDKYSVEELEEDPENDIPAGAYKYCFIYDGKQIFDSFADGYEFYDTQDEACKAAEAYIREYEIQTDEYPCDWLYPIENKKFEIVEFDDE